MTTELKEREETTISSTGDQEAVLSRNCAHSVTPSFFDRLKALKSRINLSSKAKTRLKLLISLGLFLSLFLFGKVDLSKAWHAALSAHKGYILAATILFLLSPVLNAYRWQILANAVGLFAPLSKITQYVYVGLFFNLFLPSTVGGDFSRSYYLSKGTGKHLHALTSVLVDRASGLAVLLLFASMGLLFGPGGDQLPMPLKLPIFIATFGIYFVVPFVPQLALKFLGPQNWLSRKLNEGTAKVFWQDKGLIFTTILQSVIIQIIIVLCHLAVGLALGIKVPLWYYFVFYPSVAVLGFVTPSINGIGVREWAYTYFLTLMAVDKDTALTFALIWLGLTTLSSLVGGLVYVAGKFRSVQSEVEQMAKSEKLERAEIT